MQLQIFKKKNNKTKIFINSLTVNISTIIDKLIFLGLNVIIARYLSVELFGEYSTALGFATFFSIFTDIGINQTLIRSIHIDKNNQHENFTNAIILKLSLSIFVYIILIISLYFTNYNTNTIYLTLLFGLVRIGNELLRGFYALNDALEKFFLTSGLNLSFSFLLLFSTYFVTCYNGTYFDFALIRLAIVTTFIIITSFLVFKNFKLKFRKNLLKNFIHNAIPFGLVSIFKNVSSRINIPILSLIQGTIYAGYFNNAFFFINTILFIPYSFNRVLLPFLYKAVNNNKHKDLQFAFDFYTKIYLLISSFIFLIIFLFSNDLIILIFSKKYYNSITILRILSFGIPFLFSISGIIITTINKQKINTIITGIAVIINLILNFILIYYFKAEGAAIATVATYGIIYILSLLYVIHKTHINYNKSFLVTLKILFIIIFLMLLKIYLLSKLYFIFSLFITICLFSTLTILLLIDKNDIRIIKETLGFKK